MPRPTEELNQAPLRVVYQSDGSIEKLINNHGETILDIKAMQDAHTALVGVVAQQRSDFVVLQGDVAYQTITNSVPPAVTPTSGVAGTALLSSTHGTWSHHPDSYAYQWKLAGDAIEDATNSTYQSVADDADKVITCEVAAVDLAGASTPVASNNVTLRVLPVNSVPPAVSPGSGVAGTVLLTSDNGTWTHVPASYTHQWYADDVVIVGEVAATYQTVAGDADKAITCKVKAVNVAGTTAATASNGVTPRVLPVNTVPPVITPGAGVAGAVTFTSDTGTWTHVPATYEYQWKADGIVIGGETADTYITVGGDAGKAITCEVKAVNVAGTTAATASNAVTPSA